MRQRRRDIAAQTLRAIIVHELTEAGGASIHYDQHLKTKMFVPGDYTMSAFTEGRE
jgi:hypothetical protein